MKKGIVFCAALALMLAGIHVLGKLLGLYTVRFACMGIGSAVLAGLFFLPRRAKKALIIACAAALVVALACLAALYGIGGTLRYARSRNSFLDEGVLADRRVLVVVPHPDDESNLAYAAIGAYTQSGSRVSVVYLTNGDYEGIGETRMREAVRACARSGVQAEDVYFLGYGDRWQGTHLYNRAPDELVQSANGRTRTYGAPDIPDFRTRMTGEAADYTRRNVMNDLESLVMQVRPDVILANDLDAHPDHRACSLLLEEALGNLLARDASFRPVVLKGFAYETAWNAPKDLYTDMLASTVCPESDVLPYRWSERVRFPLPQEMRAYTLRASALYGLLRAHASQGAIYKGAGILNGDEVFFERRTDSLTRLAHTDTPGAQVLWDFKWRDTSDVNAKDVCWDAGVFTGERVRFFWDEPVDLQSMTVCDAPDRENNVLALSVRALTEAGEITAELTAPEADGRMTAYPLALQGVTEMEITIVARQGEAAGLTEIELLPPRTQTAALLKLTDEAGNFVYEIAPREGEETRLCLYSQPCVPADPIEAALFDAQGRELDAVRIEEDGVWVSPLSRGTYRLRVQSGALYDEAVLNVGQSGWLRRLAQRLEAAALRLSERVSEAFGREGA